MQGFRDRTPEFERTGVVLLGASFDRPEDNAAFADLYGYRGRLLSDLDRSVGHSYQTARPSDDPFPEFAKRRTFVIDPDGVLRKVYAVKDAGAHPAQLLEDLAALGVAPA